MNLSKNQTFVLAIVVIAVICGITKFVSDRNLEHAKIQADTAVKLNEVHEHEETERTEERSQFWQKLVPWGDDETEADDKAAE